jgi:hypothetical protein
LEFPPPAGDADFPAATLSNGADSVAPGQLRVRLNRPVTGRFPAPTRLRLVLPFSRPLAPGVDRLSLALPRVLGAEFTPGAIVVSGALELEPSLSVDSVPLEPLAAPTGLVANPPSDFDDSRAARFRAPPAPQLIEASWVSHQRSVAADALLRLEEQSDDSFRVVQRIVYDVRHGRLGSLLLELPAALQDQFPVGAERLARASADVGLQVRLPDGERQPLDVQRQGGNLRVVLPSARHGTFEIHIEYALPAPPAARDQSVPFDLPVVTSLDAPFTNTVLSVRDAGRIRLRESEPGWRKSRTLSGGIAWQAAGSPPSIPLLVDASPLNVPQQYTVDSVFLSTRFGPAGEARTDAEFAVHAAPARIVLLVPDAARELELLWNGEALSHETDARAAEAGLIPCVLDLPADGEQPVTGRLRLHYVTPAYGVQDLASRGSVEFPRFPGQVRVRETRWELLLPPGHLLARFPRGMTPQFSWQRRTAVWMRRPTPDYLNRRSELTSLEPHGDVYAFSAAGPVPRVEFAAMSQSLIVLIGAGVSLLLGFLFRRVPATRSLFSLLLLGFLLALAGLWYLELMQLLLQPALLGLFLAAVATALDVAARRRGPPAHADSTFIPSTSSAREPRSSATSSLPPAPAPTALYRPAGASDSGGRR